jgi:hypothetical protein
MLPRIHLPASIHLRVSPLSLSISLSLLQLLPINISVNGELLMTGQNPVVIAPQANV